MGCSLLRNFLHPGRWICWRRTRWLSSQNAHLHQVQQEFLLEAKYLIVFELFTSISHVPASVPQNKLFYKSRFGWKGLGKRSKSNKRIKEKSWTTWTCIMDLQFFRWRPLLRYFSLQKGFFSDYLSATFQSGLSATERCQFNSWEDWRSFRGTHPRAVLALVQWPRGSVQRELSQLGSINLLSRLCLYGPNYCVI